MDSKVFEGVNVLSLENSLAISPVPSTPPSGDDMSDSSSIPPGTVNAENYLTVTEVKNLFSTIILTYGF